MYRIKRYWTYIVISIISLGLPFITINGNQIFLLSFDKKQLHLLGMAFDMQELYLMPFLLMLLFLGIFAITAIGGRVWCGWSCPQTIFRVIYRDLIEGKILKLRRIQNKQKEIDYSKPGNKLKKGLGILIWSFLAFIVSSNFMWYFVPPIDFFNYIMNPSEHMFLIGFVLILTAFLIYDVVVLQENFCVYVCPYSRVQSVLYDEDTYHAIYDNNRGGRIYNKEKEKTIFNMKDFEDETSECITCEKCVTVCPTHIDIRKGMQLECINCLECVDACTTVMGKKGKESLVKWSSINETNLNKKTQILKGRNFAYFGVLSLIIVLMFVMGQKKEPFLVNINKPTQLYSIDKEKNLVKNSYIFLFQNKLDKRTTFDMKIVSKNKENFEIKRFKPFSLDSGKGRKNIVILSTNINTLKDLKATDTIEKLKIIIYSKEDKKQFIEREVLFTKPGTSKLK
jgi:cytochrome c oxidase accessory protein FixG